MIQTVTLNSALSQNCVVCTVRKPKTQVARALSPVCTHAERYHVVSLHTGRRVAARTFPPCRDTKIVLRYKTLSRSLRTVSRAWPYRSAVSLTPARRLGRVAPWHAPAPCCDTIPLYRDQSWKMGSSPSNFLSYTFFFLIFFFVCSTHCKANQIFFFFSKSSSRTS